MQGGLLTPTSQPHPGLWLPTRKIKPPAFFMPGGRLIRGGGLTGGGSLVGGKAGGSQPVQISSVASPTDTGNATTFTFTSVSFGAADAARQIAVVGSTNSNLGDSVSSATIGGVSATIDAQANTNSYDTAFIIRAAVPTGTTGTIAITFSTGIANGCYLDVFRVLYAATGTVPSAQKGATSVNGSPSTVSIDTLDNGAMVAVGAYYLPSSSSLTGITNNLSRNIPNANNLQKTGYQTTTAHSGLSVSASGGSRTAVAAVAYGPA